VPSGPFCARILNEGRNILSQKSTLKLQLLGSASLAFAMMAAPAAPVFAQSQSSVAEGEMGAIVVTARRREEQIQDVPLAITAISGADLEMRGITNVEQLRFTAPTLQIAPTTFGPSVPGYTIRGQRIIEQIISQDPSVGVYFADVVQQRPHGTNQGLFDIESVQVLKGPQGTLFGRNTTGGAVLITPKKPEIGKFEGSIQAMAGDYNMFGGSLIANIPVNDKLAVRVGGRIQYRDGFGRNVLNGQQMSNLNTESYRISVLFEPTDNISSYTVANVFSGRTNGTVFALYQVRPGSAATGLFPGLSQALTDQLARGLFQVENDAPTYDITKTWSISNTTSFDINDNLTLKNIVGYRKVDNKFGGDFDGSRFPIFNSNNDLDADQVTEELQLLGKAFEGKMNYIVGGYYFRETGYDNQTSVVFGARPSSREGDARNTSKSLFAQADYEAIENLTITGGLRYTWDNRYLDNRSRRSTAPGQPVNPVDLSYCRLEVSNSDPSPLAPCSRITRASYKSPTYLVTLSYKLSPDAMVYATYNTGYRSGGINLRAAKPSEASSFRPEKLKNYEVGFKADVLDKRVRFNAAAYHSPYKDIQRSTTIACPGAPTFLCTTVDNATTARINGFEGELAIRPTHWLNLTGFIGYVDAKYKRFVTAAGADLSNNRFAFAPKVTYGLTGEVLMPVGADQGDVGLSLSYYHQSSQVASDVNDGLPIEAYGVLNGSITWSNALGKPLDVRFFVDNITNKFYVTNSVSLITAIGTNAALLGDPRTFGAAITLRF